MSTQRTIASPERERVIDAYREQGKIAAIKLTRQLCHVSLMDAKGMVESLALPTCVPTRRPIGREVSSLTARRRRSGPWRVALVIWSIASFVLLLSAVTVGMNQRAFVNQAVSVPGHVAGFESKHRGTSPIFAYTVDGQRHRLPSPITTSTTYYRLGDPVNVLVDPRVPESAVVDDFVHCWGATAILSAMAALFMLVQMTLWIALPRHGPTDAK